MKRAYHFAALVLAVSLTACNNSSTENNNAPATAPTDNSTDNKVTTPLPAQPEGLRLMTKSDCGTCHNPTAKVVGPSYTAIAAKYPNTPENISKLADEIIKGSSGIWSSVPMPPHAALQKPDIEKMVGYILSIGDKK